MSERHWIAGDYVVVHHDGTLDLPGRVAAVVPGRSDGRTVKVVFDDPLVYGGQGAGWFPSDSLSFR